MKATRTEDINNMIELFGDQMRRNACGQLWHKDYVCVCGTDHSVETFCKECHHRHNGDTGKCYGIPGENIKCPCKLTLKVDKEDMRSLHPRGR